MKHAVIYVPGLGDHRAHSQQLAVGLWRIYGVTPEVLLMNWRVAEPFEQKLERLLARIDTLHASGHRVSLVGVSAGASAVVSAYAQRQDEIHRVVCICGKLQHPNTIASTTYRRNPGFAESLQQLPASLKGLSHEATSRITSIKPLADESVAPIDTVIPGAQSLTIPTIGHAVSIGLAITVFSALVMGSLKRP